MSAHRKSVSLAQGKHHKARGSGSSKEGRGSRGESIAQRGSRGESMSAEKAVKAVKETKKAMGAGDRRRSSVFDASKMGRRGSEAKGSFGKDRKQEVSKETKLKQKKADEAALRKNKAYQQMKREMDQRARNRQKMSLQGDRTEKVIYVDKDRAAAVIIGNSKDIKSDLRGKKRRDRMDNAQNANAIGVDEEVNFATYIMQGEHELKSGDAYRGLRYLNRAYEGGCEDEDMFVIRCLCHLKLGNFALADKDACIILEKCPNDPKAVVVAADAKYHMGNFEHALKYFNRAQFLRPGYNGVQQGINKSKDAIENCLCRDGFTFNGMKELIAALIKDGSFTSNKDQAKLKKLGYATDATGFEEEDGKGKKEVDEADKFGKRHSIKFKKHFDDEDSDEELQTFYNGKKKNPKVREEDKMFVNLGLLDLSDIKNDSLMKILRPSLSKEDVVVGMLKKFEMATEDETAQEKWKSARKIKRQEEIREMRACNKQLLGKLYADHIYLERLLVNPHFQNGRQNMAALEEKLSRKDDRHKDDDGEVKDKDDPIQRKIRNCVQEGLDFLSARKEFWQQQKPVYARRNEALAKKRAIYHHEPKPKATAVAAIAMLHFKAAVRRVSTIGIEMASGDKCAIDTDMTTANTLENKKIGGFTTNLLNKKAANTVVKVERCNEM